MEDSVQSSIDLKPSQPGYPTDLESFSPAATIVEQPQSRLRRHFASKVNYHHTDYVLLLCWFTTGVLDSTIFNAYRTFVSMQTGQS